MPQVSGAFGAPFRERLRRPIVQILPQGNEDSEYVLSFEIGQRKSGFYSERTDRIARPSSTVLITIII